MTLLDRIIFLKEKKGLSDLAFERELGLGKRAVDSWRRGNSESYFKILPQIAKYFGVSIDSLFMGDNMVATPQGEAINIEKETSAMENKKIRRFAALSLEDRVRAIMRENGIKSFSSLEATCGFCYADLTTSEKLPLFKKFFNEEVNFHKHDEEFIKEDELDPTPLSIYIARKTNEFDESEINKIARKLMLSPISVISWASGERVPNKRCLDLLHAEIDIPERIMKVYDLKKPSNEEAAQ